MPKLTKLELSEVSQMKPYALCVTCYHTKVEVIAINHFECDEVIARFDDAEPRKYKVLEEVTEDYEMRSYFTNGNRRYYLDECVRYNTPWLGAPEDYMGGVI